MRRTLPTDSMTLTPAGGALPRAVEASPRFDAALRELATARAAYDEVAGDPEAVPTLAHAAVRLAEARRAIRVAA